jgi:hypothetical protein
MAKTSPAKVEANRQNAKKSTGPKDTSVTRLNAMKHGLLSNEVLLSWEEKTHLTQLGKRLRLDLAPHGEMEYILVDRIVAALWRLRRLCLVEREMMEGDVDAGVAFGPKHSQRSVTLGRALAMDLAQYDTYSKLSRYESSIERSLYRAFHELLRLQSARKGERPALPLAVDLGVSHSS